MRSPAPSRQALQHLTRLCQSFESTSPASQTIARRTLSSQARSQSLCRTPNTQTSQRHLVQPAKASHTPTRTFTATHQARIQPSPSEEADPQNIATRVLPDITNYYTLFPNTLPNGPPGPGPRTQEPASSPPPPTTEFSIHLPTLRKEFLQLQSIHHPDKHPTGTSAHQKTLALSSLINAAYKTLSDPLLRAQYLLQLQYEIDVTSEDNAAHPTDQDTLMEVMEAQERVEDAETQEEVDEIKVENTRRMVETEREMGSAFEEGDVHRAKEECVRLKYWRSLQSALNEWEQGKEVRLIH